MNRTTVQRGRGTRSATMAPTSLFARVSTISVRPDYVLQHCRRLEEASNKHQYVPWEAHEFWLQDSAATLARHHTFSFVLFNIEHMPTLGTNPTFRRESKQLLQDVRDGNPPKLLTGTIDEYVHQYVQQPDPPAIALYSKDDTLRLFDGFHRLQAAAIRGDATIPAWVPKKFLVDSGYLDKR